MEVRDVQRAALHPGDRLIVNVRGFLSQEDGRAIADRVRDRLKLGSQFPILITDDSAEIRVISAPDAEKWFDEQMKAWKNREAHKIRANGGHPYDRSYPRGRGGSGSCHEVAPGTSGWQS